MTKNQNITELFLKNKIILSLNTQKPLNLKLEKKIFEFYCSIDCFDSKKLFEEYIARSNLKEHIEYFEQYKSTFAKTKIFIILFILSSLNFFIRFSNLKVDFDKQSQITMMTLNIVIFSSVIPIIIFIFLLHIMIRYLMKPSLKCFKYSFSKNFKEDYFKIKIENSLNSKKHLSLTLGSKILQYYNFNKNLSSKNLFDEYISKSNLTEKIILKRKLFINFLDSIVYLTFAYNFWNLFYKFFNIDFSNPFFEFALYLNAIVLIFTICFFINSTFKLGTFLKTNSL